VKSEGAEQEPPRGKEEGTLLPVLGGEKACAQKSKTGSGKGKRRNLNAPERREETVINDEVSVGSIRVLQKKGKVKKDRRRVGGGGGK